MKYCVMYWGLNYPHFYHIAKIFGKYTLNIVGQNLLQSSNLECIEPLSCEWTIKVLYGQIFYSEIREDYFEKIPMSAAFMSLKLLGYVSKIDWNKNSWG